MKNKERKDYFKNFTGDDKDKLLTEEAVLLSLGFVKSHSRGEYHVYTKELELSEKGNPNSKYSIKCVIDFYGDQEGGYEDYHSQVFVKKTSVGEEYEENSISDTEKYLASEIVRDYLDNVAKEIRTHGLVQLTGKDLIDLTSCKTKKQMEDKIDNKIDEMFSNRYHLIVPENEGERFAWEDLRRFWDEKEHKFDTDKQFRN